MDAIDTKSANEGQTPASAPAPVKEIYMWSPSSWATWKQCPAKFKIKSERWSNPERRTDSRIAVLAVPGLVIDQLFEMWLHRESFEDHEWLAANFDMTWNMVVSKRRPKWSSPAEEQDVLVQTHESVGILYNLMHEHDLFGEKRGIQEEFHLRLTDRFSIAGGIDYWCERRDGKLVLLDFKNFSSNRLRSTDQLHFYALALAKIFGREPDEAGYLCFNPKYSAYQRRELRRCDRQKLLSRLERATDARAAGRFEPKWSPFGCGQFCEVRFGCKLFRERCGNSAD